MKSFRDIRSSLQAALLLDYQAYTRVSFMLLIYTERRDVYPLRPWISIKREDAQFDVSFRKVDPQRKLNFRRSSDVVDCECFIQIHNIKIREEMVI